MKVYFYEEKNQRRCGTNMLLKYLLRKYGIEVLSKPENADFIFISIYDVSAFNILYSAFKIFHGKISIVAGGDTCKLDFVLNYADYVVRGEAYNFIKEFSVLKRKEDIINISNVYTKNKTGEIDYKINYPENPIIKASSKVFYYYGGKGCPQHCKFCFYSYVNQYSQIDKELVLNALKILPFYGKLYLTSAYFPYPEINDCYLKRLGMIDLKINQYLKKVYPNRSFRIGVEFFSESLRKKMGKPIANNMITELIEKSLYRNHEIVMYFMAGLEMQDAMFEFIDQIPFYQKTYAPRIMVHFQYIDFNEMTPLQGIDIRNRNEFNYKLLQKELNLKNRRFRIGELKYIAYSSYRTLLQRTKTIEETEFIYSMRNEKNNDKMINNVINRFPHLIGNKCLNQ